jgi:hypothetical protein
MARSLGLAVFAGLLAWAAPARAQLIAYEGFNYPAGQSLDTLNGGTGFVGPWSILSGTATVQPGSLVPAPPSSGLPESGNSLAIAPSFAGGSSDSTRTLSTPIIGTPGTSAWVGVVMKGNGESGSQGAGALILSDNGVGGFSITTGASGSGIAPFNPPPSSTWSIGDSNVGASEGSSAISNTLQSLLVARITFGAASDLVDLYVNPALGGGPPATANATIAVPHAAALGFVTVTDASLNVPSSVTQFDEIRIGGTFADVTGAAVPEPSTFALVGLTGLGLLRRRKSR